MFGRALRRRRRQARLSVVIPVYNVEQYLSECLDSVLGQQYTDLEVLLVDDGSTDGSAAIAADYARRHPNVELLQTSNHGLGAARNTGSRHVSGELLAFVDSDDTLPPYAYTLMIAALDESGSDLVVGSMQRRFDETGELSEPGFLRPVHRQRRLGVTVEGFPLLMRNGFAWDKVFRRAFWDSAQLAFPEGVRYEDQPAMIEAYLRASAIDVVRRPVYHWRIRRDGSSITQRRHEIADLRDRITTKLMTTQVVRSLGSVELLDFWARNGLAGDLPHYFREILHCDDAYWQLLRDGMRQLFAGLPPIEQSQLRVVGRVVGWLVAADRRADAERVREWVEANPGALPVRVEADHVVALLPLAEEPDTGVPARLFWLADHELEYDARLLRASCEGGVLVIEGIALIRGAPPLAVDAQTRVWLHSEVHQDVAMVTGVRHSPEATAWVNRPGQNYDRSGFVAQVDLGRLGDGSWTVMIEARVADITRAGSIRSKAPDLQLAKTTVSGRAVALTFDREQGLKVDVGPVR